MRRAAVLLFAVSLTASAFAQSASAAPSNWPTAQFAASKDPSVHKAYEVLNQMLRALGGDDWLNVQTMTSEGRAYSFYHGQPNSSSILFWRFWQWPDKDRLELTKKRDIIELLIGDQGYETTYKGTSTQDPKEVEQSLRRRAHSLEWVVRKWLPGQGTMILYSGTAMVERNLADQVTVLNAQNDSVTISVDSTTHLPVKVSYSWRDPVDRQFDDGATVYGNYKLIQGVQTPYSVVQYRNDEMSAQRFLTSATYNVPLEPTLFEPKGTVYNPEKQSSKK
ncbi:MAG TPA: hypothetical protein VLV47_01000 [Candidatus Bathyarchaeia archaeon]|nr:hypothetical protein [Candidatus Bathyarchaeia archaeon]